MLVPEQDYNSQTLINSNQDRNQVNELDLGQHEKAPCYKKMPLTVYALRDKTEKSHLLCCIQNTCEHLTKKYDRHKTDPLKWPIPNLKA